jgi:hypothetical protein
VSSARLKFEMAQAIARSIVEQPDKHSEELVGRAQNFVGVRDYWLGSGARIEDWERASLSWGELKPLLPVEDK